MTAEGDNSVLMQKVAKERLTALSKTGFNQPKASKTIHRENLKMFYVKKIFFQAPSSKDLSNRDYLMYLINAREMKLFAELGEKMAKAGREGTFKTWMLEESDLIQAAAKAYGERLITERYYDEINCKSNFSSNVELFFRFLETLNTCDADLKPILGQLFDLHASSLVEKNLAWYLISEVLEVSQVRR
jgi:acyl-CoA oxidase